MSASTLYLTEAAQDEREIAAFVELLAAEGVRRYLEVGVKFGGAFWRVGQALAPGARMVSVDMPGGTRRWAESEASLKACRDALQGQGQDVRLIWGASQDATVIEQVRALGPYDAVLIDADHRLAGVTHDWEVYGPMARLVAFHDIAWHRAPTWEGTRIDVPQLWANLRRRFRHRELCHDETGKNNGIGVLWRDEAVA